MHIPETILPCPYCRIIIKELEQNKIYTQNEIADLVKSDMTRKTALLHIHDLLNLKFLEDRAIHKKPKQIMLDTFNIAVEIARYNRKTQDTNSLISASPLSSLSMEEQIMVMAASKLISKDLNEAYEEILTKLTQIDHSILTSVLHLMKNNPQFTEIITPQTKIIISKENVKKETSKTSTS